MIKKFTTWVNLYIIERGFTTESWRKESVERYLNNINEAFHNKVTSVKVVDI